MRKNMRLRTTLSLIGVALLVLVFKIVEAKSPMLVWAGWGVVMAGAVGWIAFLYWTRGRSPR